MREAVAGGDRLPDFGPPEIGRAGATAVGARKPLVAFNTYLSGDDEAAAKDIARTIRESSADCPRSGDRLRGPRARMRDRIDEPRGLRGHGVLEAFDAVEREAKARGMEVLDSEIVGLAPEAALPPGAEDHVRLAGFDRDRQILDRLVDAG